MRLVLDPYSSSTARPCAAGRVDMHWCPADGRSGLAVLAACAARRWLARSAAIVHLIRNVADAAAPACMSLVFCLPALEDVTLNVCAPVVPDDLGCLLEALAWCPRLRALDMSMDANAMTKGWEDQYQPFPAPALAQLSSLTSLGLRLDSEDPYTLEDVVNALVPLTGLVKLSISFPKYADIYLVPAALGELKALQSLEFRNICDCVLEAGCLDLPKLQSLDFLHCSVPDAKVLPGVSALQCLTRIHFVECEGPVTLEPELAQLPGLQRLVLSQDPGYFSDPPGRLRLPADMGSLRHTLLHLDISGHTGTRFPLAVTQLVALELLNAKECEFPKLPAGITALSRLTELRLGRLLGRLHGKPLLNARALGDLSRFPGLCKLTFESCEVKLHRLVLGAAQHASLKSLCFNEAHPALKCVPAVLQLGQELWRLGRGSVLECVCGSPDPQYELRYAQGRTPGQKFMADLEEACGL